MKRRGDFVVLECAWMAILVFTETFVFAPVPRPCTHFCSGEATSDSFDQAIDPNLPLGCRLEAVSKLNLDERAQLRSRLLLEIPVNWDKAALDAVHILGQVGDKETSVKLEALQSVPNAATGKFGSS